MKFYFIILLLLSVVICEKLLISQDNDLDDDDDFVGGIYSTKDSNSDSYQKALQFAQQNYAIQCHLEGYIWESLDGSKNQMVQGILYYFNVTFTTQGQKEHYELQVWIQAGTDSEIEITKCKKI